MVQAPQRSTLSGPALVRLLARFADVNASDPGQSLSDRLSQWLGWTDAIALSTALSGRAPLAGSGARGFDGDEDSARVRRALTLAITGGRPARDRTPARQAVPQAPADYADFRQRHVSLQQAMETDIGQLRGRLRVALAARTPELARLAMVDAIMERALGARERSLLAAVPSLLGAYFERLGSAAQDTGGEAGAGATPLAIQPSRQAEALPGPGAFAAPSGAWLDVFRKDRQSVLLAELEVRFQPVEGLLAALRTR